MNPIDQYIENYKAWLNVTPETFRHTMETSEETVLGVKICVESHEYEEINGLKRGETATVTFSKGELSYSCSCCDLQRGFFPICIGGKNFIFFSRTLYGFVLLDCETLEAEYEHFPEIVLDGEESFIVTDVKQLKDLLRLGGCYWACPDEFFLFDYHTKRFLSFSRLYPEIDFEREEIEAETLTLHGKDKNDEDVTVSLTKEELLAALDTHGTADFRSRYY